MPTVFQQRLGGNYTADRNFSNLQHFWDSGESYGTGTSNLFGAYHRHTELESEVIARDKALGPMISGYIPLDENGEPGYNATFYCPVMGRVVSTDAKGRLVATNKDRVEQAVNDIQAMERYIDDIAEMCLSSNAICAQILNMKHTDMEAELSEGNDIVIDGEPLDPATVAVKGTPSSIRQTSPGSQLYLNKLSKLRALVKKRIKYVNLVSFGFGVNKDKNNDNLQRPSYMDDRQKEDIGAEAVLPQGGVGGQPGAQEPKKK